jgi:hypothetical protein
MTGQPAASSAVPKNAPTPPSTQAIASATQINRAKPNEIFSETNALHSTGKNSPPNQQQKTEKSAIRTPQFLFRLERTPIPCFHTLTQGFNRTHVSVRNEKNRHEIHKRGAAADTHKRRFKTPKRNYGAWATHTRGQSLRLASHCQQDGRARGGW